MRVERLTLKACEKALGEPALKWAGRCFEIASRIVKAGLVDGVAVYGHWIGPVRKTSMFHRGGVLPFVQHGWIVLKSDTRVVDPTRWAFEGKAPYLFLGAPDFYDEGGNGFRAAMRGSPPEWDPLEAVIEMSPDVVPSKTWRFIEKYLRLDDFICNESYEPGLVTREQVAYLANAPLEDLGEHASGVYDALERLGEDALVPIDNWRRVRGGRWPARGGA